MTARAEPGGGVTSRPLASTSDGLASSSAWAVVVWGAMLGWSIAVFAIVRDHFVNIRLGRYDLGNMVQAVWSTAQGRPLEVTDVGGEQATRLAGHVDPILVLLAPLWAVAPTPLTLVAVQVSAVALGALPVFWLARRHSGSERAAGLLALAYLSYPWIAWSAVDAFHPVTLAIPLLLFCVWFLDTDRLWPFVGCALLVAATGELMGLVLGALGLWYALARGRRATGLTIAVTGLAWTLVALEVVIPAFSDAESRFYGHFEHVGGSPAGIVATLFTDPTAVLAAVATGRDVGYVLLLAVPLAGAFLLSPALAAASLPQLGVNLLADWPSTTDPHAHYVAGILPFLFAATAVGLTRVRPERRARLVGLVLTLSVAATVVVGPWPGALGGAPNFYRLDTPEEHIEAVRRAVALVPESAPVSSTNRAGSHLAARRYAYSVPAVGRAEWIVLDSTDTWLPARAGGRWDPDRLRGFQLRVERSPTWEPVFDESGVLVFRKVER